jgi:PAS domain S-box-containing protein
MNEREPSWQADELAGIKGFRAMAGWMQELAPYGIFTTDADLRIITWNHWMAVHSGLEPEQVVGRLVEEVVPDLAERRITERFRRALSGEISVLSTALHKYLLPLPTTVQDSGHEHMLQTARIAPLREGGTVVGTLTIIEDVTQREVQAMILRRQQELDRLLSTSLAMLLQASEPAREIGTIFSSGARRQEPRSESVRGDFSTSARVDRDLARAEG